MKIQGSKTTLRDCEPKPRVYVWSFKARIRRQPPGKSLLGGFTERRERRSQRPVGRTLARRPGSPAHPWEGTPQRRERKCSGWPGSSGDLVHVSSSMAPHRSGPLKQQNKAHKGGRHRGRGSAQRDGKGKKIGLEGEGLFYLVDFNCFSSSPRHSAYLRPVPSVKALRWAERGLPFLDHLLGPRTKAFSDLPLGRLALKTLSKKVRKELSRVDQRHRANQLRKQKKEAVREEQGLGWCVFTIVLG